MPTSVHEALGAGEKVSRKTRAHTAETVSAVRGERADGHDGVRDAHGAAALGQRLAGVRLARSAVGAVQQDVLVDHLHARTATARRERT